MLCSRCGYRDVPDDSESGFCAVCDDQLSVMGYEDQEAEAIEDRKAAWRRRTRTAASMSKASARARQRRHRLKVALTPREPPPPGADPYEIGKEAVIALNQLRPGVAHSETMTMKLELAEERVKWLAIGPQTETESDSV